MIEIMLFVLVGGVALSLVVYGLGFYTVPPEVIFAPLILLILPGLYAAFRTAPFVPSARKRLKNMLLLADVKPHDAVVDLGCGDSRLVFAVAGHAAAATGYDLSIPLIWFAKLRAFFSKSRARFHFGDLFKQDYRQADVLFCYLLPRAMERFYAEIWPHLKKGTRVVSNAFLVHALTPTEQKDGVYLYVK